MVFMDFVYFLFKNLFLGFEVAPEFFKSLDVFFDLDAFLLDNPLFILELRVTICCWTSGLFTLSPSLISRW